MKSSLLIELRQSLCSVGGHGTHVYMNASGCEPSTNTLLAERHSLQRVIVGQHAEDEPCLYSHSPWGSCPRRPLPKQALGTSLGTIEDLQRVACLEQVMSHRQSHIAQANKANR